MMVFLCHRNTTLLFLLSLRPLNCACKRGDILDTRTKGHTVVVLSNGPKSEENPTPDAMMLGDRILKNGCTGEDVKQLQSYLIQLGYDCGSWGADGDFGDCTEQAVEEFQQDYACQVDGEAGPETIKALYTALGDSDGASSGARYVNIVGGNCYVRTAPNTSGKKLGVAHNGDKLKSPGQTSSDGWNLVEYKNQNGWVSGKYSRLGD